MSVVRAALVQTTWTGDKESMIARTRSTPARPPPQGAQVMCFQELFYGPYFCQVQDAAYYEYAESVPGPDDRALPGAGRASSAWCIVLPMYEQEQPGFLYNTAAVVDADGTYLGKYRKHHIPQVKGFWEKFYFRPGNLGFPVFDTAVGRIGVYICYDRHFPEGWRALGLNGAQIVFNPSATSRGLSSYLWKLEQPAAAVANEYFVGAINRVGVEDARRRRLLRHHRTSSTPRASSSARWRDRDKPELIVRDLDIDLLTEVRNRWAFYRDRRPDAYGDLRPDSRWTHVLIPGGTVVSPTGSSAHGRAHRRRADRRRCWPRATRAGQRPRRDRRRGHRRHRQVRDPRRHRLPHAHGAAVRRHLRLGHVRDRHPGGGVGRHDDDHRLRRAAHGRARAGRARGVARQGRRAVRHRLRLPPDHRRRRRRRR